MRPLTVLIGIVMGSSAGNFVGQAKGRSCRGWADAGTLHWPRRT
jgi:hypothetical protein